MFFCIIVLRPGKQFFSHVETEPPIPGYYQYFLGSKCLLLKETTHRPDRGSNPGLPIRSPTLCCHVTALIELLVGWDETSDTHAGAMQFG